MAGGILLPYSVSPQGNGNAGLSIYNDGGAGLGPMAAAIVASLAADTAVYCDFLLPQVLPTGTPKLQLWLLANATSGVAKITPYTTLFAAGSKPTQTVSGTSIVGFPEAQQSITWAATGNQGVISFTIGTAGTGYAVGDVFAVSGGTQTQPCWGVVTAVTAGVPTAVAPMNAGVYSVTPGSPATTTVVTGTGSGTLTVTPVYSSAGESGALKTVTTGQIYANQALTAGAPFRVTAVMNTSGWTLAQRLYFLLGILWS